MIGVLGGMGPAATIDFMTRMLRLVPAERDQEHVPLLVVSDPRVPDRVGPILGGQGESPLPAMRRGVRALEAGGATCIAIPCHTAHHWLEGIRGAASVPVLSIIDAALFELERLEVDKGPLGLLATAATLDAGLYQGRLEAAGWTPLVPDAAVMAEAVLPAIARVKEDRAAAAGEHLAQALRHLQARGARSALLACTELPLAVAALDTPPLACIDGTEALARACLRFWNAGG